MNAPTETRRNDALDALRGFALLGIIVGNVTWFSGYAVATPAAREALGTAGLDEAVASAVHTLVDGKFYGLFSLIFGAGFALMLASAEARGHDTARLVRRRLWALLAIGVAHATLLWFGDIISLYAVAAVPLAWLHRASTRRLASAAIVCLTVPVVVSAVQLLAHGLDPTGATDVDGHGPAALLPAFGSLSVGQCIVANWEFLRERWALALHTSRLVRLVGMFALGMLAVRLRPAPSRRVRLVVVAVALASNLALAQLAHVPVRPATVLGVVRDLVYAIAIPTGAVAYAAMLWPWLCRRTTATRALAAAGRLSMTHYLTQSLAMALVFYGCGLGLWGRVGLAGATGIALGIAGTQVLVSQAWLRRVAHGPGEWLLRRLSRPGR